MLQLLNLSKQEVTVDQAKQKTEKLGFKAFEIQPHTRCPLVLDMVEQQPAVPHRFHIADRWELRIQDKVAVHELHIADKLHTLDMVVVQFVMDKLHRGDTWEAVDRAVAVAVQLRFPSLLDEVYHPVRCCPYRDHSSACITRWRGQ
jgi:hypothetical protein